MMVYKKNNILLSLTIGIMCSFPAYSKEFSGDGESFIARGSLSDFTMSDTHRIIAHGGRVNISQGILNDNTSIIIQGGVSTSDPLSSAYMGSVWETENIVR